MSEKLTSDHWQDSQPVLLRDAMERAKQLNLPTPHFGDGVWDLSAMNFKKSANPKIFVLNFDRTFPNPEHHLLARELTMQRLHRPVTTVSKRRKAIPARVEGLHEGFGFLSRVLRYMGGRKITYFSQIDQTFLDNMIRKLGEADVTRIHISRYVTLLHLIYEAGPFLTGDKLEFLPWQGASAGGVAGVVNQRENKTQRIPEKVMGPLLAWAMDYVNDFSADIIDMYHKNLAAQALVNSKMAWEHDGDRIPRVERVERYFAGLRARGEKAPVRPGTNEPAMQQIMLACGLTSPSLSYEVRKAIADGVADVGLEDDPFTFQIRNAARAPRPWRDRVLEYPDIYSECRNLTAACYIICAFLSGMRDSELQAMEYDCLEYVRDKQGRVVRYHVKSRQFKGTRQAEGMKRTWVVIEPVARAIEVLQKLTSIVRDKKKTDSLFLIIHFVRGDGTANVKSLINVYIRSLIDHINSKLVPHLDSHAYPRIPTEGFQPITTRMFRRTVAWYIANRPFGVVAGMIQFGHMSSTMFEGYAGSSASGFRKEVEIEQILAKQKDIIELAEEIKNGINPAGPMGAELTAELKPSPEFVGSIVDDKERFARLNHYATRFYPGLLADCFFEAEKASCLSKVPVEERQEPVSGICSPHCGNACWRPRHLPFWEDTLKDIERLSKENRLERLQRQILKDRKAEYLGIVEAIRTGAMPKDATP